MEQVSIYRKSRDATAADALYDLDDCRSKSDNSSPIYITILDTICLHSNHSSFSPIFFSTDSLLLFGLKESQINYLLFRTISLEAHHFRYVEKDGS